MPVIVYGPIPCLLRAVHWVRLANEPRVTFAAAVDSKTGVNALAGAENPNIDKNKKNTEGTAMIIADLLTRRRRIFMEPPKRDLQFYHFSKFNKKLLLIFY